MTLTCSACIFLLRGYPLLFWDICGCHLEFSKQRKVGERKKFLPRGWLIGEREGKGAGLSLPNPSPPTFTEIKHDSSANYC